MKATIIPIVRGAFATINKGLLNALDGLGGRRMSGVNPNYSIIQNSKNTEKNPGDLRRLAVTQTPAKD